MPGANGCNTAPTARDTPRESPRRAMIRISERTISCRPKQYFGWLVSLVVVGRLRALILTRLALAVSLIGGLGMSCAPNASSPTAVSATGVSQPSSSSVPIDADDAVWGDPAAPVTMVVFVDFECRFCARGHDTVVQLRRRYGPEALRVVYKHAPLPFHLAALPAARAAQAVNYEKGAQAFFDYADVLFANTTALGPDNLEQWASAVGLDPRRLRELTDSQAVVEAVERDMELAESVGVDGVPAFLINGAQIVGARPLDEFERVVEHELRAAKLLKERGTEADLVYAERVAVNLDLAGTARAEPEEPPYVVPVGTSPSVGPEAAAVTIVEFADFECAFCRKAHATIATLMQRHPGQIRWVMKHHPLDFHPLAVPAAVVALQVHRERGSEAYWGALQRMFVDERLQQATLDELIQSHQLDAEALARALSLGPNDPQLTADRDLAMDLGAQGTPHFFINGRRVAGAQPLSSFEAMVQEELAKVEALKPQQGAATPYERLQRLASPPPGLERMAVELPPADSPSMGPLDAPVVVQMFSDFECGYCGRVMPTLEALRQRYPNEVRVVWRHLPLPFHRHARPAAAAALEVRSQKGDGAFWKMTNRLFGREGRDAEQLDAATLSKYVAEFGADMARYDEAMRSGVHDAAIERDLALAEELGFSGTPTFVVGRYKLVGAQPLSRFERLVRLSLESR